MKQRMTWEEFHGPNLGYVLELYDQYVKDPESLDADLKEMFDELGAPRAILGPPLKNEEADFTAGSIQKLHQR